MKKKEIQNYINNFRRVISSYLKPNVGMQSTVYPFDKGAIIIFEVNINSLNKDDIRTISTDIYEAFKRTNLFENENGEHLHSFAGTNIILVKNKIVLIKDNESKEWTLEAVDKDIFKIIKPSDS